jgi:hypothetical protein
MCLAEPFKQEGPDIINTERAFQKIALPFCAKWCSLNNMIGATILPESFGRRYLISSTSA